MLEEVTAKTQSFVSAIANTPAPVELVMMQVHDHVKMKLISQWINGISRVFQKLFKYFNGTAIARFFVLRSAGLFLVGFLCG